MTGRISISDARLVADGHSAGDPLRFALLEVIAGAEALRRIHDEECACDEPAGPECAWPEAEARLLARFEFDEVEEPAG